MVVAASSYKKNKSDLVPGHSYSVLGVNEVEGKDRKTIRLVKVFNPWNKETWKDNPWADGSKKWTTRIKRQVGYKGNKDGLFYLSFEDFKKKFELTFYAKVRAGWESSSIETEFTGNKSKTYYYKLSVKITHALHERFYVFINKFFRFSKLCEDYQPFIVESFKVYEPNYKKNDLKIKFQLLEILLQ